MRGVVGEYRLDPANLDEVIRRITDGGVPILQSIPGFVSYAISDPGDGRMLAFAVYEDESGTRESTRQAAEWARDNLGPLRPNPPEVIAGGIRLFASSSAASSTKTERGRRRAA